MLIHCSSWLVCLSVIQSDIIAGINHYGRLTHIRWPSAEHAGFWSVQLDCNWTITIQPCRPKVCIFSGYGLYKLSCGMSCLY